MSDRSADIAEFCAKDIDNILYELEAKGKTVERRMHIAIRVKAALELWKENELDISHS